MHCRCEKGHGLGNPVPLRVRAAARHVAHKSKIVRNELNLVNQKLNPVTRRSLAILPIILPVMPLTVDGEPKTMPEAKPCCQHGLMAAIKAAGTGDTVLIPGGTYTEQIVIDKSITLAPMPGETVIVRWVTDRPYESALIVQTPEQVSIQGITIQHSSPSIANNYAVYLGPQCSSLTKVEGCTIVSNTGSGVGIEGGTPTLLQSTIRGCAQNGVCIYGNSAMEDTDTISLSRGNERPIVKNCTIEGNGKHGVLIRDGVTPSLDSNLVENNAGYGLVLQNCGGFYENNVFEKNKKGSIAYWLADVGDSSNVAQLLASSNTLLGGQVVETRVTN